MVSDASSVSSSKDKKLIDVVDVTPGGNAQATFVASSTQFPPSGVLPGKPLIASPYLTPAEAAQYLKISPRTLRRWTRGRVVPHIKIRQKILYKINDLDAALAQFKISSVGS